MAGKISVYVRREDDTDSARRLTRWPVDDMNSLLALLRQWGVSDGENTYCEMWGHFVDNGMSTFFEVVYA